MYSRILSFSSVSDVDITVQFATRSDTNCSDIVRIRKSTGAFYSTADEILYSTSGMYGEPCDTFAQPAFSAVSFTLMFDEVMYFELETTHGEKYDLYGFEATVYLDDQQTDDSSYATSSKTNLMICIYLTLLGLPVMRI